MCVLAVRLYTCVIAHERLCACVCACDLAPLIDGGGNKVALLEVFRLSVLEARGKLPVVGVVDVYCKKLPNVRALVPYLCTSTVELNFKNFTYVYIEVIFENFVYCQKMNPPIKEGLAFQNVRCNLIHRTFYHTFTLHNHL